MRIGNLEIKDWKLRIIKPQPQPAPKPFNPIKRINAAGVELKSDGTIYGYVDHQGKVFVKTSKLHGLSKDAMNSGQQGVRTNTDLLRKFADELDNAVEDINALRQTQNERT